MTDTDERRIAEDRAEIVRRIFRDFAVGEPPRAIAKVPKTESVPASAGGNGGTRRSAASQCEAPASSRLPSHGAADYWAGGIGSGTLFVTAGICRR